MNLMMILPLNIQPEGNVVSDGLLSLDPLTWRLHESRFYILMKQLMYIYIYIYSYNLINMIILSRNKLHQCHSYYPSPVHITPLWPAFSVGFRTSMLPPYIIQQSWWSFSSKSMATSSTKTELLGEFGEDFLFSRHYFGKHSHFD